MAVILILVVWLCFQFFFDDRPLWTLSLHSEVLRKPFRIPTTWETATPSPDYPLPLKHGDKKYSEIFRYENGVPTLDCHRLAREEAEDFTRYFLRVHSTQGNLPSKTIKIITGRGLHSYSVPIIQPAVEKILSGSYEYTLTNGGGAFIIWL